MRYFIILLIIVGLLFALSSICKSPVPTITDNITSKVEQSPIKYHDSNTLPIAHPYGGRIELLYNPNSHNPSYDELLWFLHVDNTDSYTYLPNLMGCSEFAELLQNNSTKANIRCGYVSVRFADFGSGHACNVFETTDEGLVFIDCTGGRDNNPNKGNDKIVSNFGAYHLYTIKGFNYTSLKEYQELRKRLATFEDMDKARPMRLHGMTNEEYKQAVEEYTNRQVQIEEIKYRMKSIYNRWGDAYQPSWFPLGIVSNYILYWPSQTN